jgi:tetratricopeptide (TPR) repeat protein
LPALLNRSAAYLKLGDFEPALDDLRSAERLAEDSQMQAAIAVRRAAIDAWHGRYCEALEGYAKARSLYGSEFGFSEDVESIERRSRSDALKAQGDERFRKHDVEGAVERYQASLEVDPINEVALANLAQAYLNLGQSAECLQTCEQALPLLSANKELKVKVLVRKAKSLEDQAEAMHVVRLAQSMDPQNEAVLDFLEKLEACESERVFTAKKEEADSLLRASQPKAALEVYRAASKMTRVRELKAAVLANMAACHLSLNSLEDVLRVASRALKLHPSDPVALRLYMRRAKAYAGLGQKHAAITDLKSALVLEPGHAVLMSDLAKLQA